MAIIQTPPEAFEELEIVLEHGHDRYGAVHMTPINVDGQRGREHADKLEITLNADDTERAVESIARRSRTQSWVARSGSRDQLDPMREIGERLYRTLFPGERARFLRRSLEEARSHGRFGLRLRIRATISAWEGLPWEFLHDGQEFMSLSPWSPVVRWAAASEPQDLRPLQPPVRVLVVSADSTGMMAAQDELKRLQSIADRSSDLEFTVVPQATHDRFLRAVESDGFHVLHFIGGTRRFSAGKAALVLMRPDGETLKTTDDAQSDQITDARELGPVLARNPALRLILLNACHSATLAAELASAAPATIGMRAELNADSSINFAAGFYTSLLDGVSLEVAVTGGRQAVDIGRLGTQEWGLPCLYLQSSAGTFLVRGLDETGERSAHAAEAGGDRPAAAPSDPAARREWQTLRAMREIYQRNLDELRAQVETSLGKAPSIVESQIQVTEDKIAKLDEQMRALADQP